MGRGRDFDVANGQTEGRKDLPHSELLSDGLDPLRCADSAHFLVFKAGQDVWKERGRPNGVVVGENDDIGSDFLDSLDHLHTLVGVGNGDNTNALGIDGAGELLEGAEHLFLGNDDDLLGLSSQPAPGSFLELFSGVYGGNDDGDIVLGDVGGIFRKRDRFVCKRGSYSDQVP